MIGLKELLEKLITSSRYLPNWFDPDHTASNELSDRPTTANITPDSRARVRHFLATSSTTTGKPRSDGNILHFSWDNANMYATQLAVLHGDRGLQYRYQKSGDKDDWYPWRDVYGDYTAAAKLTLTYTSNSYVNKTNFARIQAWKIGKMVVVVGNLQLSAAMPSGSAITYIGKITDAGTFAHSSYQTIVCGGGSVITSMLVAIETDGKIGIYNYSSASAPNNGWVRFQTVLICE